jgi:flagellar biosynthesis anti-sigma factor FlgM
MSIKMSDVISANAQTLNEEARKDTKAAQTPQVQSSVEATASVEVSSHVQQLHQKILETPAVDMSKVEQIKQKIANSALTIDHHKIAQNILAMENQLFSDESSES